LYFFIEKSPLPWDFLGLTFAKISPALSVLMIRRPLTLARTSKPLACLPAQLRLDLRFYSQAL